VVTQSTDGRVASAARHRSGPENASAPELEAAPVVTAMLGGGPLAGRSIDVDVVEGRPPKTIDVLADDGTMWRYCLAEWAQSGPSAAYTFLYRV
jgi:hypothetical protein